MGVDTKQSRYVYQGPYSVGDIAPIPFQYIKPEHIEVYRDDKQLELNVEYTITGQNIYLQTPIAAAESLTIARNTARNQDSDYPQEGKFDSAEIEEALDKLTMQQQEQDDKLSRAVLLPINSATGVSLGLPVPEPNKALKWNADLTSLENTKYDIDEVLDKAVAAKDEATRQANVASTQAADAKSSALFAAQKLTETTQAAAQAQTDITNAKTSAVNQINTTVADGTSTLQDETMKNIEAIDAAGLKAEGKAKLYAQGTIEELPSGSAKYWADVAKEVAQLDTYTKSELDGKFLAKQNKLTPGDNITIDETTGVISATGGGGGTPAENTVTTNTEQEITAFKDFSALKQNLGIRSAMKTGNMYLGQSTAITPQAAISTHSQGLEIYTSEGNLAAVVSKLTGSTGSLTVEPSTGAAQGSVGTNATTLRLFSNNGKLELTGSTLKYINSSGEETNLLGGTTGGTYTKDEIDLLLAAKQQKLIEGNNISILSDGTISCTLDTYNRTEITGLLNLKQNTLTPGSYMSLTNNTINVDTTKLCPVFDAATWEGMSTAEKQALPLAFIKE